ncbi:hypothetical protein PGO54_04855 [Klebsiella aerogenes]
MKTLKVTITDLLQIKAGVVCGAKVTFKVIQSGYVLVEKVVSGKATGPFTLSYDVDANDGPLVVEHDRPDIQSLRITASLTSKAQNEAALNQAADEIVKSDGSIAYRSGRL